MTVDTLFDLASITKPLATACSVMKLVEEGKLGVEDFAHQHLPEFTGHQKEHIRIRHLLLHTSGLTPDNALSDYADGPEQAWERICELPLRSVPGERFAYSDVGFIVLGKLVERLSGCGLDAFARQRVFLPLGMSDTGFCPNERHRARIAPTEMRAGEWIRGQVHDPRAFRMKGVAGHAGVFSTAADLIRFGQSFLQLPDEQHPVFSKSVVEQMTSPRKTPRGTRTLGWDHQSPYSRNRGTRFSKHAFGPGGFTGTVLWIDPGTERVFVFLSSRLHPDGEGNVNPLAGDIATLIGENAGGTHRERAGSAEPRPKD